ncbi:MAG: ester cyclase [Actinomycetota bacterium]
MAEHANRDLMRRYLEQVWGKGDIGGSAAYLTPGYRRHVGAGIAPLDPVGQQERLQGFRTAFPDVTLQIEQMIAEGDVVAFRFILRGTHRGPFLGIEPTGRVVEVSGMDMVRFEAGLLAEHWGGADIHSIRQQLTP